MLSERLEKHSIPEPNSGCVLWCGAVDGAGYGLVKVDGKCKRSHRAAYELAHGPIPEEMHVCHKCDVPSCINVDHLFLGSHTDNMRDKMRKGRHGHMFGEKHGSAKLTDADVLKIRSDKRSQRVIAATYGLRDHTTVGLIKRRLRWSHLQ